MTTFRITSYREAQRARAWAYAEKDRIDAIQATLPAWWDAVDAEDEVATRRLINRQPRKQVDRALRTIEQLNGRWENVLAAFDAVKDYAAAIQPLTDYTKARYTMDREAFFEAMTEPDAPDEMAFVLRRDQPDGRAFSVEGVQAMSYQVHDLILARTLAHWRRTGEPPRNVQIDVQLRFDQPDDAVTDDRLARTSIPPWYALDDVGAGMTSPDGTIRLDAFLAHLLPDGARPDRVVLEGEDVPPLDDGEDA